MMEKKCTASRDAIYIDHTPPWNANTLSGAANNIGSNQSLGTFKSTHLTRYAADLTAAPSLSNSTKKGVRRPERESCSLCFRTRTPMDLHESPDAHLEHGLVLGVVIVQRLGELADHDLLMVVKYWVVQGIWGHDIDFAGLVEVVLDILGWQDQDLPAHPLDCMALAAETAAAVLSR
jgi:hypothetical protein